MQPWLRHRRLTSRFMQWQVQTPAIVGSFTLKPVTTPRGYCEGGPGLPQLEKKKKEASFLCLGHDIAVSTEAGPNPWTPRIT
jgi:hypothetical protein